MTKTPDPKEVEELAEWVGAWADLCKFDADARRFRTASDVLRALVLRNQEQSKALDEIWEIASMADESDRAFSAMGALETIADIASNFEDGGQAWSVVK